MSDAVFQARLAKALEVLGDVPHIMTSEWHGSVVVIGVLEYKDFERFMQRWTDSAYTNYFHERAVRLRTSSATIRIDRAPCVHCRSRWEHHIPEGGKCPFASTHYHDDDGTLPELRMMHLIPTDAKKRARPTFSECVKAIRRAVGAKDRCTEKHWDNAIIFVFPYTDRQRFNNAFNALARLNPIFGEQYVFDDTKLSITVNKRSCKHCKQWYSEHVTAGGQCMFAATKYQEQTGEP